MCDLLPFGMGCLEGPSSSEEYGQGDELSLLRLGCKKVAAFIWSVPSDPLWRKLGVLRQPCGDVSGAEKSDRSTAMGGSLGVELKVSTAPSVG